MHPPLISSVVQRMPFPAAREPRLLGTLGDLVSLTKPRLSGLVLATEAAGMALAPGRCELLRTVATLVGTACLIGSANVFNSWLERGPDSRMARTRGRALPAGRVEPQIAAYLGGILGLVAAAILAVNGNLLTLLLGLLAFGVYVFAYTPLKARTWWALPVGAIPGALPPLMGWTATAGTVGWGGAGLFALLFAWQIPHFLAIALFRNREYAAAGFAVFPLVHGEAATRVGIAVSAVFLLLVSGSLPLVGLGGVAYAWTAGVLGAVLVVVAVRGAWRGAGRSWARWVFRFSLLHLVALFSALLVFRR